jgi:hypothetical protein
VFGSELSETAMGFVWGAFVVLVKTARHGYLNMNDATLAQAREACWRAFAVDVSKAR